MYEFNHPEADAMHDSLAPSLSKEGWLIQWIARDQPLQRVELDRYLQIGTGQWCAAEFATRFPARSTAVMYAQDFRYIVGQSVQIVWRRF